MFILGFERICLLIVGFLLGVSCAAKDLPVLVIGSIQSAESPRYAPFIDDSIESIRKALEGKYIVKKEDLSAAELRGRIAHGTLHYFFSDSMFYLAVSASSGPGSSARMSVLWHPKADNPSRSVGGTVIARRGMPYESLESLRNRSLAVADDRDYQVFGALKRELIENRFNPSRFFHSVDILRTNDNVIDAVLKGKVDAGVIPTCYLEDHRFDERMRALEPIALKEQHHLKCATSTELYLGPVFASTSDSDPYLNRLILQALLNTPSRDGYVWTGGGDLSEGHELFKTLNEEQYGALFESFLFKHLEEKKPLIFLFGLLLFLLVAHWVRVNHLVNKRTRQLQKIQSETNAVRERLNTMQKVGVVGLMSSTVSHELKQPIAVIGNYLQGIRFLNKKGKLTENALNLALDNISAQIQRADAIIQKVRSYAKKQNAERIPVDLVALVKQIVSDLQKTRERKVSVQLETDENRLYVEGDPTELQLAVHNLLKNALEACESQPRPVITIRISSTGSKAEVQITDNGPMIPETVFSQMTAPLWSSKPGGMGLGLPIVQRIAEAHRGSLLLHARKEGGLSARLQLPLGNSPVEKTQASNSGLSGGEAIKPVNLSTDLLPSEQRKE